MLPHLSLKVSFKSAAAIHHSGQKFEKKSNNIYKQVLVKWNCSALFCVKAGLKINGFLKYFSNRVGLWRSPGRVQIEGNFFLKKYRLIFDIVVLYILHYFSIFGPLCTRRLCTYYIWMRIYLVVLRRLGAVLTSDLFGKYNFREHDWKDKVCTK